MARCTATFDEKCGSRSPSGDSLFRHEDMRSPLGTAAPTFQSIPKGVLHAALHLHDENSVCPREGDFRGFSEL